MKVEKWVDERVVQMVEKKVVLLAERTAAVTVDLMVGSMVGN